MNATTILAICVIISAVGAVASVPLLSMAAPAYARGATNLKFGGFHAVITPSGNFHFNFK
jgi:hypothetical protein